MNAEKDSLLEVARRFKNVNADFLHNLTHEYLTPLSIISLNVQILEMLEEKNEDTPNAISKKHLHNIKNQVTRLNEVVHDSMDLLKLDTLNESVDIKETNVIELISTLLDSIDLCKHKLLYHNHTIEKELLVNTDQKLLRTCIFRLVNHACSTYKTRLPELILKHTKDTLLIQIVNHEISLDTEDFEHLFNPFRRTSEMEKIEGMSLALTVIKTRLRLAGSDLLITSADKGGIIYSIELPRD